MTAAFTPTLENVQATLAALRDECSEGLHYRILTLETGCRWQGTNIYLGYGQETSVATAQAARADAVYFFALLHGATAQAARHKALTLHPPETQQCELFTPGEPAA